MMKLINEMTLVDTIYADFIFKVFEDENDERFYEVGYYNDEVVLIMEVKKVNGNFEEVETIYEA